MEHSRTSGRASAPSAAHHLNTATLTAPIGSGDVDFAAQRPSNCSHLRDSSLQNIDALIAHAKEQVEKGETIPGTYFVRCAQATVGIFPDVNTPQERDALVRFMKNYVARVTPDFVLMVANSWTLPDPTMAKYQTALEKYGSVKATPKAIRSVIFSLETSTGLYVAMPRVVRKSQWSTRKTLDHACWNEVDDGNGTLQRVFPARGAH